MAMLHSHSRHPARRRQRGLTLIEFMISIVLGMILVAALAVLIADQSGNRAEVDRSGRLIENGRYSVRSLAEDLQLAGYWGELSTAPAAPTAWADPCGANPAAPTQAELEAAMGQHVTGFDFPGTTARDGYNDTTPLPGGITLSCLANIKPGTDVIVIRRVDPDSSAYETAGVPDTTKLASVEDPANAARLFVQTGLHPVTSNFTFKMNTGANHALLDLERKDKATKATVRKLVVRMYYVTTCSICSGTPDSIPTLKMRELDDGPSWSDAVTIAEGIENLQVEYGLDTAPADGAPDGADVEASSVAIGDWPAAVTAKVYMLTRSLDASPGYQDSAKTYPLGLAGTVTPAGAELGFKRHVFVQSVRLVNPGYRRSL